MEQNQQSKSPRDCLPEDERRKIVELAKETLLSEDGKEAREYLKSEKRHFSDFNIKQAIDIFSLGYVPAYVKREDGMPHEFSGRMIMPIYSPYGELIALDSRDWRSGAFRKFFHESFAKSFYLYALNVAKNSIVKDKRAIVVEGSFDAQFLHLAGIRSVVGALGSAFQLYQMSLLRRYTQDVYLVFDGDDAGIEAMDKFAYSEAAAIATRGFDMNLFVCRLPKGYDPDQFVYSNGEEKFLNLVQNSRKI
jgi:DNA primase